MPFMFCPHCDVWCVVTGTRDRCVNCRAPMIAKAIAPQTTPEGAAPTQASGIGWLRGWPRRRVITACNAWRGPLLTRYFLLQTPAISVYLHHLHVSDEERALHDHPWTFITCLLSSGYYEWTPASAADEARAGHPPGLRTVRWWRRRFSVLYRPARWQHRLELVRPTWTLVVRFRRHREWGFITPRGWQHWRAYAKEWCD